MIKNDSWYLGERLNMNKGKESRSQLPSEQVVFRVKSMYHNNQQRVYDAAPTANIITIPFRKSNRNIMTKR